MAYTFMAESAKAVDWTALHGAVIPIRKRVELFPIPASNGLGLSIPQRLRNDLASGAKVGPDTLEKVKSQFIAE